MNIRNFVTGMAGLVIAAMMGTAAIAEGPAKHHGLYVSGALGLNWANDSDTSGGLSGDVDFESDLGSAFAVGYGFGNGLRLEGELSHRNSDVDGITGATATGKYAVTGYMANLLYDFNVSSRFVPYVGLGAGLATVNVDDLNSGGTNVDDEDNTFAWQAIVGVAIPLSSQLDLTADYRYFDAGDVDVQTDGGASVNTEYATHSAMIGLRYRFGAPKREARPRPAAAVAPPLRPAPAPAPPPMAKPAPKPAPPPPPRSFIVFFDWDRANIRPDAAKVLEAAAAYAKRRGMARVNLSGHADRSGQANYNMGLSLRRAQAAKAALVKLGIDAGSISLVGRGESEPLVSTADGVREPRNRRVEIAF